jgi:hypothetical protein
MSGLTLRPNQCRFVLNAQIFHHDAAVSGEDGNVCLHVFRTNDQSRLALLTRCDDLSDQPSSSSFNRTLMAERFVSSSTVKTWTRSFPA